MKAKKITQVGNLDLARAMQEKRRSSAASPIPSRKRRREGSRSSACRAAVRDQM